MPLIESPGVLDGDPHQVKLIKRDPQGSYGSLEHRSVSDVERESFGLEKLTSPLGLGLALLGEIHVGPAGEEIFLVPDAFAVAQQYDLRHGLSCEGTQDGSGCVVVLSIPSRHRSTTLGGLPP